MSPDGTDVMYVRSAERVRHGPSVTFLIYDFEIFNFSNVKNIFLHTSFPKCSDPKNKVYVSHIDPPYPCRTLLRLVK